MYEITKEASVLLHLLKKHLHAATPELPEQILKEADWKAVMEEAGHQAVLISAFDAAAAYKEYIPAEVYQQWFQRVSRGLVSNLRVSNAQRELTELLTKKGYPYIILKGEASAAYYPKPDLRHLGDIDFLIDPRQKAELETVLIEAGYIKGKDTVIQHVDFRKSGVCLEMHFNIPGFPQGKLGELVRDYLHDLFRQGKMLVRGGQTFRVPEEAHHGLILLLHMQNHMVTEGLGLRHLCDWAAFVDATWQQAFWQEQLLPLLRKLGLLKYTEVMTQLCTDVLGTHPVTWGKADTELCSAVLQDILTGGNFGRKDMARSKAGMMIPKQRNGGSEKGSVYRLWKILHQSTYHLYPIVRKVRFLHPVFDLYRVGLYLFRVVSGRRFSLSKLAPLAKERTLVYEQLQIFEVESEPAENESEN